MGAEVAVAVAVAPIDGVVGVEVGKADSDGLCVHANARTTNAAAVASTPDFFAYLLNSGRCYPHPSPHTTIGYPVTCSRHPDPSVLSINSA